MSKKVIVGFVVFFILLLGIAVFFAFKGGPNYFSYKSYLRSIQQNDLDKPNSNSDISDNSSQQTSSNGLDNIGITNPGNSSNAANTTNTMPDSSTSNKKRWKLTITLTLREI